MHRKDTESFRQYLYRLWHSQIGKTTDGKLAFTKDDVVRNCPFEKNKYREQLAAIETLGLGLVKRDTGPRPYLVIPDRQEIEEIHTERQHVESEVCFRVAHFSSLAYANRRAVEDTLNPVHSQMVQIKEQLSAHSDETMRLNLAETLWELDGEFHELLSQLAGWPWFGAAMRIHRDRLRFVSTPQRQIIERLPTIIKEHQAIIDAVTERRFDKDAVAHAVDQHLLSSVNFLEDEIKRRNELKTA